MPGGGALLLAALAACGMERSVEAAPSTTTRGPIAPAAAAPDPAGSRLEIGGDAPGLEGLRWITGAPAGELERGRVLLVVFWAPWSGTSTQTLARLAELERRHAARGLDVLAVSAADARGTTLERARRSLHELAGQVPARTAFDTDGTWRARWIGAEADPMLPVAFLVDRTGRIASEGSVAQAELRLPRVLADQHDLAKLAAEAAREPELLARSAELQRDFHAASRASDWPRVLARCDELLALDLDRHRRFTLAKFQVLLLRQHRAAEAYAYARALADGIARDDVGLLNSIAWTIVDPHQPVPERDLALAGRCAQRAVDLTLRRNAVLLDTLARVHAAQGEFDRAIAVEEEAARIDPIFAGPASELRAKAGR